MAEPLGISARDAVRLRNLLIAFEQGRLNQALPGGWQRSGKGQDVFLGYISSPIAAGATGAALMVSVDGTPTATQLTDLDNTFTVYNPASSTIPAGYVAMVREPTYGYWLACGLATSGGGGMTNPMTSLGDMIYEDGTPLAVRLPGNMVNALNVLTQTGTGTASAAPQWKTPLAAGIATGIVKEYTGTTTSAYVALFDVIDNNGIHGSFAWRNTGVNSLGYRHTATDFYGRTGQITTFIGAGGFGSFNFESIVVGGNANYPFKEFKYEVIDQTLGSHTTFDVWLSLVGTPTGY